jgi:DNA-directed RNA polymerase subunit beta'
MGYIELNYPIVHLWYTKEQPNYIYCFLKLIEPKLTRTILNKIIYCDYDINSQNLSITKSYLIKKNELGILYNSDKHLYNGTEIVNKILSSININFEISKLRSYIKKKNGNKDLFNILRILESFLLSKISPDWMVLKVLPVLPPSLRPLLEFNGKVLSSDLNQLYERIILCNKLLLNYTKSLYIDEIFLINYKNKLQQSVDILIDKKKSKVTNNIKIHNTELKSLSEFLEGKYGRFRNNILGKRVDFSARSVITVDPLLKLNQCGLPYEVIHELLSLSLVSLILGKVNFIDIDNFAVKIIEEYIRKKDIYIWTLFNNLLKKYYILLNRAPTLHRLGIQSFEPFLVFDKSIHLHPLLCASFNADFDGDQMGIYLPLTELSQLELKKIMKPSYNILSPSSGNLVIKPTQDMVIGCYYLTLMNKKNKSNLSLIFKNEQDIILSLLLKRVNLHTPILLLSKVKNFVINKKESFIYSNVISHHFNLFNTKILKILKSKKNKLTYYFLTNIGIFITEIISLNCYLTKEFFFEITPGRLLFNFNFKTLMKFYVY